MLSSQAQPSPELKLICLLLQLFLKTASAETIKQHLADHPPDPEKLLQLLRLHHLTSVVYLTFKQSELLNDLSPVLQEQLTTQHQRFLHQNLKLTTETIKLIKQFQQADIRVIPLKGTLLSQQLYGSFIHRDSSDIDLLVEPGAYDAATTILERLNYHREEYGQSWTPTQKQLYVQQRGEVTFLNPTNRITIDLHARWSSNKHLFTLSFDDAWQQATQLPIANDNAIPVLGLPHQLLYLSVHGAKHRWERLSWLLDIAQLLQISDSLEIDSVQKTAQTLGIERPIQQALELIPKWLSYEPPNLLQQQGNQSAVMQWLVTTASHQIRDRQDKLADDQLPHTNFIPLQRMLNLWQYQLRLKPGLAYRQACFTGSLFSIRDWQMLPLPEPLWFLYIPLRPLLYVWRLQKSGDL